MTRLIEEQGRVQVHYALPDRRTLQIIHGLQHEETFHRGDGFTVLVRNLLRNHYWNFPTGFGRELPAARLCWQLYYGDRGDGGGGRTGLSIIKGSHRAA